MTKFHPPILNSKNPLEEAARNFHYNNPHVFVLAETLMSRALAKQPRYSMRSIWHLMRWHYDFETSEPVLDPSTGDPLKLNDHHTPYYARWLLLKHSDWEGKIRIRSSPFTW